MRENLEGSNKFCEVLLSPQDKIDIGVAANRAVETICDPDRLFDHAEFDFLWGNFDLKHRIETVLLKVSLAIRRTRSDEDIVRLYYSDLGTLALVLRCVARGMPAQNPLASRILILFDRLGVPESSAEDAVVAATRERRRKRLDSIFGRGFSSAPRSSK